VIICGALIGVIAYVTSKKPEALQPAYPTASKMREDSMPLGAHTGPRVLADAVYPLGNIRETPLAPWSERHPKHSVEYYADAQGKFAEKWLKIVMPALERFGQTLQRHAYRAKDEPWFLKAEAAYMEALTDALNAADPEGAETGGAETARSPPLPSLSQIRLVSPPSTPPSLSQIRLVSPPSTPPSDVMPSDASTQERQLYKAMIANGSTPQEALATLKNRREYSDELYPVEYPTGT
jgi:hypothetical protein